MSMMMVGILFNAIHCINLIYASYDLILNPSNQVNDIIFIIHCVTYLIDSSYNFINYVKCNKKVPNHILDIFTILQAIAVFYLVFALPLPFSSKLKNIYPNIFTLIAIDCVLSFGIFSLGILTYIAMKTIFDYCYFRYQIYTLFKMLRKC